MAASASALVAACALLAGGIHAAAASTGTLRATSDEPRAYGWRVGDLVRRHVTVEAPAGFDFDAASLPPLGRHGTALELRDLHWTAHRHLDGSHRIELSFSYQVFVAPKQTRVYELPAIQLAFRGAPAGAGDVRVDPWPVAVSPLTPEDTVNRRGLGDFRPDARTPPVSTVALRWQLTACAAAIALLALYLLHVYAGLPWRRARQRPFAVALRTLRRRRGTAATRDDVRAAYRTLHAALNRTAGGVLFAGAVDGFLEARPAFAPLRADLLHFYAQSDAEFFAAPPSEPPDETLGRLAAFARRCRDAESARA